MSQDLPKRFYHVSYVTSLDQLADTIERLGSRLGSTLVVGGVRQRFSRHNFTLPPQNVNYKEVVLPLGHRASFAIEISIPTTESSIYLTRVAWVDNAAKFEKCLNLPCSWSSYVPEQ